MTNALFCLFALTAMPIGQSRPADETATPSRLSDSVRAEIRAPRTIVPVGSEVIVEFLLYNKSETPVRLTVPNITAGKESPADMGLPLEHVFSGPMFRGLEVATEGNPYLGDRVIRKPELPVPPITLAPFGMVGIRFDVAKLYPGMHQTGIYQLKWRPYGGQLETQMLSIKVIQFKQVVMDTDFGPITMSLLYDKAPKTVENFLDLVNQRFYNSKLFHVVYPGEFVLGGCPSGSGTGRRPDGLTLAPEFNATPFEFGTVGMALIESDENSASSQFFICLNRQPTWDGKYTAFAQVEGPESLAILKKLGEVPVDENHKPAKPLKIKGMASVDLPFVPRTAAP